MRRFKLMFCIAAVLLGVAGLARAESPDGFRGLKWGQAFETVKDEMIHERTDPSYGGIEIYQRKNDEMAVGGAKVDQILYGFWQKKFYEVAVVFSGKDNFALLKDALFERFGSRNPLAGDTERYAWAKPGEGFVSLEYAETAELGLFIMTSAKLYSEAEEFEKKQKKERSQKGF